MTIWQQIKAGTIPPRLTVAEIYALTEAGLLAENEHFDLLLPEVSVCLEENDGPPARRW